MFHKSCLLTFPQSTTCLVCPLSLPFKNVIPHFLFLVFAPLSFLIHMLTFQLWTIWTDFQYVSLKIPTSEYHDSWPYIPSKKSYPFFSDLQILVCDWSKTFLSVRFGSNPGVTSDSFCPSYNQCYDKIYRFYPSSSSATNSYCYESWSDFYYLLFKIFPESPMWFFLACFSSLNILLWLTGRKRVKLTLWPFCIYRGKSWLLILIPGILYICCLTIFSTLATCLFIHYELAKMEGFFCFLHICLLMSLLFLLTICLGSHICQSKFFQMVIKISGSVSQQNRSLWT